MLSTYQDSLTDEELLAMRESIAVIDARLADILKRVDKGEAGQIWDDTQATFHQLRKAMEAKDPVKTKVCFDDLAYLINRGVGDYAAWREFFSLLDLRGKTSEREQKRLVQMGQMISAEKALVLFTAIGDVIRRNVQDQVILGRISDELALLIDKPDIGVRKNNE